MPYFPLNPAIGEVVQVVSTGFNAVATGATAIPLDDTVPQISEGVEFMTQAITPKSATNILVIRVVALVSTAAATQFNTAALFQDATANALAVDTQVGVASQDLVILSILHRMAAGTTSATTFRVRCGSHQANTLTFNGRGGARLYGDIPKSTIVITEYKA